MVRVTRALRSAAGVIAMVSLSMIAIMPAQAFGDEYVQPEGTTTVQSDGTAGSGAGADANQPDAGIGTANGSDDAKQDSQSQSDANTQQDAVA